MGMFDNVSVKNRTDTVCPAGHPLVYLQTKDTGESLSTILVDGDDVEFEPNYGDSGDISNDGSGEFFMYEFCSICYPKPADYGPLYTFHVKLQNWKVVSLRACDYSEYA